MRKPLSIVILSILFLISPLLILFFNAALNMVPLFGYGSIFFRLGVQDYLILGLYPLAAISIFPVRKWGWWLLIGSATLMILYNFMALFYNPFSSTLIVLLMNGALFAVALFFFRKHLIAPYFNPRLRWWEQDQRYDIDIYLNLPALNRNGIISDISEGGCYIFVDFPIETGAELPVIVVCGSFRISLNARIMRSARETDRYYGYGLMFLKTDEVQRKGLDSLLEVLRSYSPGEELSAADREKRGSRRFHIPNEISVESGDELSPVSLSDFSMSGCSFSTSVDLAVGASCRILLHGEGRNRVLGAEVVWRKELEEKNRYGLKFTEKGREERAVMKQFIRTARELGATKRETDMDDYYRLCDESALQTPYRIIYRLRNLARRY